MSGQSGFYLNFFKNWLYPDLDLNMIFWFWGRTEFSKEYEVYLKPTGWSNYVVFFSESNFLIETSTQLILNFKFWIKVMFFFYKNGPDISEKRTGLKLDRTKISFFSGPNRIKTDRINPKQNNPVWSGFEPNGPKFFYKKNIL